MPQTVSVRLPLEHHFEIVAFLDHEAELLDEQAYEAWFALLDPDITYRMPVRITSAHSLRDSALDDMQHFEENHWSLRKRVDRFATEHAWAEDPPSRTRRFVTNVRTYAAAEQGEYLVKSYLLLFRSRGDATPADLVSCERIDTLRRGDGDELRLLDRRILVDESVLRTQNLALFL